MASYNSSYPQNQGPYGNQGYPPPPHQPPYPSQPYPTPQPYPPQSYPQGSYGQPYPESQDYRGETFNMSYGEDGEVKGFDFTDKSIRRAFIRKVYSILMIQLAITAAIIAAIYFSPGAQRFVANNPWLFFLSLALVLGTMIALACCGEVRRRSPMNYILLIVFTAAEGFMLAIATTRYDVESILMAVGITAALCLGLTLFAFQTKIDFTLCGGFLFVCVFVLLLFGIVISIFSLAGSASTARTLNLVYACIGAVLFSIFLIYDTQLLLGGKHTYSVSPEEYVFAALSLYVDIINIFIYILTIIGFIRD